MCISVWCWQSHPLYKFVLLSNRDEYHKRATTSSHWWADDDGSAIFGGRDCVAGGTWLGCTKNGRLAFLTNFREPNKQQTENSRGQLPVRFLKSTRSPLEFAEEMVDEANLYAGFNLILTDLCSNTMVYVSNRPKGEKMVIRDVSPGLHVLSNANLDSPWPKALRLRSNFNECLTSHEDEKICAKEMIEKLMTDTTKAERNMLADTGCSPDWEYDLSSIFIEVDTEMGRYGTRSMVAVLVDTNGDLSFYERYLEDCKWKEHNVQFHIENLHE